MGCGAFFGSDRAHARMEADEGAATDGDARWCAGHHVVIARTMVALVMAYRSDDRVLVRDASELWQVFADLDPWNVGVDRLELTADFDRSFGLGVKGYEVGGATIHPYQDAAGRFLSRTIQGAGALQMEELRQAATGESSDAQLKPVSSQHGLILVSEFRRVDHRPEDIFDQFLAVCIGFSKFSHQISDFRWIGEPRKCCEIQFFDDFFGRRVAFCEAFAETLFCSDFSSDRGCVHQVQGLDNGGVREPFARWVLIGIGSTEGIE